jgi:hypothetical protein
LAVHACCAENEPQVPGQLIMLLPLSDRCIHRHVHPPVPHSMMAQHANFVVDERL